MSAHRWLRTIILGGLLTGVIWIGAEQYENRQAPRDETLFVYGTLTSPVVRFLTCRCHVPAASARLPGYRLEGRTIVPDEPAETNGLLLQVTEVELARFDRYERVPDRYLRIRIDVAGTPAWVYTLLPHLSLAPLPAYYPHLIGHKAHGIVATR